MGFRFHFYSDEGTEPPHIHVEAGDGECKFWLSPVALARQRGMNAVDTRTLSHTIAIVDLLGFSQAEQQNRALVSDPFVPTPA